LICSLVSAFDFGAIRQSEPGALATDPHQSGGKNDSRIADILHLRAMGNVHTTICRAFTAAEMDKIVARLKDRCTKQH
jgi:hypothetical protein